MNNKMRSESNDDLELPMEKLNITSPNKNRRISKYTADLNISQQSILLDLPSEEYKSNTVIKKRVHTSKEQGRKHIFIRRFSR